ncbi:uncharacterized protein [Drosophila suzukii]|uniref:Uncharacterized protein n=1 Tax=Drosophila suzukii TaxID=28584 RepID=A0AB40DJR6_DROSZ
MKTRNPASNEPTSPDSPGMSSRNYDSDSTQPFVHPGQMSPIGDHSEEVYNEETALNLGRLPRLRVEDDIVPGTDSAHWSLTSWLRTQNHHSFAPGLLESCVEEFQNTEWTDSKSSDDSSVGGDGRFGMGGYQPPLADAVRAANAAWDIYLDDSSGDRIAPNDAILDRILAAPDSQVIFDATLSSIGDTDHYDPVRSPTPRTPWSPGHLDWSVEMDQFTGRADSADDSSLEGDGLRVTTAVWENYLDTLFLLGSPSERSPYDAENDLVLASPDSPPLRMEDEIHNTVCSPLPQTPPTVTLAITPGRRISNPTTPRAVSSRAPVSPLFLAQGLRTSARLLPPTPGRTVPPAAHDMLHWRKPRTSTSETEDTQWGLQDLRVSPGAEEALSEDHWVVAPLAWRVDTHDRRLPPTLVQFVLQHERTRVRFFRHAGGHRFRITISGQRAVTISICNQKE